MQWLPAQIMREIVLLDNLRQTYAFTNGVLTLTSCHSWAPPYSLDYTMKSLRIGCQLYLYTIKKSECGITLGEKIGLLYEW